MKKENNERLDCIISMLIEIATGNFSYRIVRSNKRDRIEAIAAGLNMTAEELENSLLHQCYINKDETYINKCYLILLLDKDDKIMDISPEGSRLIKRESSKLLGSPLIHLLDETSRERWKSFRSSLDVDTEIDNHIRLEFITKHNLLLTLMCNVITSPVSSELSESTIIIGSLIKMEEDEMLAHLEKVYLMNNGNLHNGQTFKDNGMLVSKNDIQMIRKFTDYLFDNLNRPMESLIDLARSFGTNEFKLKRLFKYVHGQTIFRFVQNERLRMAELLIKHDDQPIFKIAKISGFKNLGHFSRIFKEKYGESPINYRKRFHIPSAKLKTDRKTVK